MVRLKIKSFDVVFPAFLAMPRGFKSVSSVIKSVVIVMKSGLGKCYAKRDKNAKWLLCNELSLFNCLAKSVVNLYVAYCHR